MRQIKTFKQEEIKKPKRVHYAIFEDLQKYVKDINPDDYEQNILETDPSVIKFLRDYYDEHLPVDVTAWIRVNTPDENCIYGRCLAHQLTFVRDELNRLLYGSYKEYCENPPMVISFHSSKSVKLPIYRIYLEKYGLEIILRNNFYSWKLSFISDTPLDFDYMNLFDPDERVLYVYCEGIPKDKIYGCYNNNHSRFTIKMSSDYDLYALFVILSNYLGINKESRF